MILALLLSLLAIPLQQEQDKTNKKPETDNESLAFKCVRVALRRSEADATLRSDVMRRRIVSAFEEVKVERPKMIININYHLKAVQKADLRIKAFKIEKAGDRSKLIRLEALRNFHLDSLSSHSSAVGMELFRRAQGNESFPSKEHLQFKKSLTLAPCFYLYGYVNRGSRVSLYPDAEVFDPSQQPAWPSRTEIEIIGEWQAPEGTWLGIIRLPRGDIRIPRQLLLVRQKKDPKQQGWVSQRFIRYGQVTCAKCKARGSLAEKDWNAPQCAECSAKLPVITRPKVKKVSPPFVKSSRK